MAKRISVFSLLILFFPLAIYAQNQPLVEINNRLQAVQEYHENEDVFLHLSQPSATPGEVIWFSGYITDTPSNNFSDKSRMLHTKLINNRSQVVTKSINKVKSGKANGSLIIPDTLSEGTYNIVSYSSWMKNFSPENYYSQQFEVHTPQQQDLQLTLVYADSVFRPGEKVRGSIFTFDKDGNPLNDVSLSYQIRSSNRVLLQKEPKSDQNEFKVNFTLPERLATKSGILKVNVQHGDKKVTKQWAIPTQFPKISVRFFPEGGNFVEGLQNRMAFKTTDEKGNPVALKAALIQNSNTVLDTVKTIHNGMGSFGITPVKGNSYHLKILEPYSTVKQFPLPTPSQEGYLLQVSHSNKDIFSIRASAKGPATKNSSYITLDMGGKILWGEAISLDSTYSRNLSSKKLPMGIARLTLFNNQLMPQAERLVFLNPDKKININLSTDRESYQTRDKVSLTVETLTPNGDPIQANLSLSAHDTQQMAENASAKNILSSLLLESELRGHISNPNYYFAKTDIERIKALDHLLMIHGWRSISWEKIEEKDISQYTSYNDRDGISGTVLQNGASVANASVKLLRLGQNTMFKNTSTDKNGRFSFPSVPPVSKNVGKVRLSATAPDGDDDVVIKLDREYLSYETNQKLEREYVNFAKPDFSPHLVKQENSDDTNYLVQDPDNAYTNVDRTLALDEVVVTGQRLSPEAQEWLENKRSSNTFSQSISGEELRKANYSSLSTVPASGSRPVQGLINMIKEASPVYAVHGGKVLLNPPTSIQGETGALFIVDGSRAGYNLQNVAYLSVDNIKEINVYDGAASGKYAFAPSGVIEIETMRGADIDIQERKKKLSSNETILQSVYTPVREFYSPDYSKKTEENKEKKTKDYRSTIHWEPNIMTDKNGKTTLSFYLTDAETEVKIIANGLTSEGVAGSEQQTITVSKD